MNCTISTGQRVAQAGQLKALLRGCVLRIYSGVAPTHADSAVDGGSLLATLTSSLTNVPASQQVTVTPTAADATLYSIKVNDIEFNYLSGTGSTVADITAALTTAINAVTVGVVAADNTTNFSITTNIESVGFDVTVTAGDMDVTTVTADPIGLHWNLSDSWIISQLSGEMWQGVASNDGTATFYRISSILDDGSLNTDYVRIQGDINASTGSIICNIHATGTAIVYAGDLLTMTDFIMPVQESL